MAVAGALGALVALGAGAVAPVPAAAAAMTITAQLDDCTMLVGEGPLTGGLTLTIRRGTATKPIVTVKLPSDGSGTWRVGWSCATARLRTGDRIRAVVGSTSQQWVVPAMPASADPAVDLVAGSLPNTGGTLKLYLSPCFDLIDCYGPTLVTTPDRFTDATWSSTVNPPFDLNGSDQAFIDWTTPGAHWTWNLIAPYIAARPGSAVVSGRAQEGLRFGVKLLASGGAVRATGTAVASRYGGRWKLTLRKNGVAVKVRPGDRVRAQLFAGSSVTVIDPGLVYHADSGLASATCLPGAPYLATAAKPGSSPYQLMGTADGTTGAVELDFSVMVPATGWTVTLRCKDPIGMQVVTSVRAS
ncbi:MAG: hypothetical protein U0869_17120 [Chloroflexota bacterium]